MVTYLSQGLKVKGMLAEPKEEGLYDGLLYLRGGIKNVGKVRPSRIAQFAQEGLIVFAPFYRGNQGGEGDEDFAGEDRYDAFSGFELLKHHERVHKSRIHIFGFSRGGVMALFTAIQYPEALTVTTWGGVSDMALIYKERKDLQRMMKRVIGSIKKHPNQYEIRTPLNYIEQLNAPILIIHGMLDQNVSVQHALMLEQCAKKYKKQVEKWYFQEYDHHFPPLQNKRVTEQMIKWMKKH